MNQSAIDLPASGTEPAVEKHNVLLNPGWTAGGIPSPAQCRAARLSRDERFDGRFVVAVMTTSIFCRPICPARTPEEKNVRYFADAAQALHQGYRPCLRCRPESAPGSAAWRGTATSFERALRLIGEGGLDDGSTVGLAERLGISDRYLRALFRKYLGLSPARYARLRRLLFARSLLHDTSLPIRDIALASGYTSVRRFNEACRQYLHCTPTASRRRIADPDHPIQLRLPCRAPLDWLFLLNFYRGHPVEGVERVEGSRHLRTFALDIGQGPPLTGWYRISPARKSNTLDLEVAGNGLPGLQTIVQRIRRLYDLDTDGRAIAAHLAAAGLPDYTPGLRIPGVWDLFEGGVRAILGQQVSVAAAARLLSTLVQHLGSPLPDAPDWWPHARLFPTPLSIAGSSLEFLKMPSKRRDTLRGFAQWYYDRPACTSDPAAWLQLNGIGPWTRGYAFLRGAGAADHFMLSDLVVRQTLSKRSLQISAASVSPWGSYATLCLWQLSGKLAT